MQTPIAGDVTTVTGTVSGGKLQMAGLSLGSPGLIQYDNGTYIKPGGMGSGTGTYIEAFSGCGFPASSSPTLSISYGVVMEQINPGTGIYFNTPPCDSAAGTAVTTTDGGAGLTLSCNANGDLFKGAVSFGTDNTSVFQTLALGSNVSPTTPGTMNGQAALVQPQCVYIPAGNYLTKPINSVPMGTAGPGSPYVAKGYGCWLGDEHYHSNIFMIPNTQGDMFAWVDANYGSSINSLTNTQLFSNANPNMAGSSIRNLTIIGDRLSIRRQNAIVFYGIT